MPMMPVLAEDRLIGTRFEKCVVERLIGRGGYGLTFLAFDEELQEHRVVKLSHAWSTDEIGRQRHEKSFIDEGYILSRLKHPQIVTLRGQGDSHGHRYMILDYIQGFSLKAALNIVSTRCSELGCRWDEILDPATATALVLSSLHPLEYAHKANVHLPDREIFGVAHRDISPGNLILGVKGNEKGKVVLIDFGTAKTDLADSTTVNQNLVGTVPYMSKARLQKAATPGHGGEFQTFWSDFRETQNDMHALGVLYYQLLTGRLPFAGENTPQIIVKVLDPESYVRIRQEAAAFFPYATGILRKSLVYQDFSLPLRDNPYQYPDAAAMRPDLEAVFSLLSPDRSIQEVLLAFNEKLTDPDSVLPLTLPKLRSANQVESAEFSLPILPKTLHPSYSTLPPIPKSKVWLPALIGALSGFLALGIALWMGREMVAKRTRIEDTRMTLEPIEMIEGEKKPEKSKAKDTSRPNRKIPRKNHSGIAAQGKASNSKVGKMRAVKVVEPVGSLALLNTVAIATMNSKNEISKPVQAPSLPPKEKRNWSKEVFVQLQTSVREKDPGAYEKIEEWLREIPDSPDLLLLKCQLVGKNDPTSPGMRKDLIALMGMHPAFLHPQLFHESALYLLWLASAATYDAQKTSANRISLIKAANAYLSEFQANPGYHGKVQEIKNRLPK